MTNYEMFLEQVKYISMVLAARGDKVNTQALHHAFCVDPACIQTSSGQIYVQAHEFVALMSAQGQNAKNVVIPPWLEYKK